MIARTTPLRRMTLLLVRRRPLPQQSERGRHQEAVMRQVRPVVKRRAKYRCEVCGLAGLPLDTHHVYGRPGSGACLGEMANAAELCVALCRLDHAAAHSGLLPEVQMWELKFRAYRRFVSAHLGRNPSAVELRREGVTAHQFSGLVREAIRELEPLGMGAQ